MNISNLRVVVLGGNGFIGSHLVDALITHGCIIKIFDQSHLISPNYINSKQVQYIQGDFSNELDVANALNGSDVCFHLISTVLPKTSNLDPLFDIETNLSGSVRLLNQAVKAGIKKIIFLSSGGTVYGTPFHIPIDEHHPTNPICSYGITKLAIEKYLSLYHQLHGLNYAVLRLSNPFGERQRTCSTQGAVAVFLGKTLRKETIEIWGDGSVIRDYIHISDVINAMLKSITYKGKEHLFNIGSGQGMSLNKILNEIEYVTEIKVNRTYIEGRTFDVPTNILSIERAAQELQWVPALTFTQGLTRMINWIKEMQLCPL